LLDSLFKSSTLFTQMEKMEKKIKSIMTRSAPVVKTSTIKHAKCEFTYFITSNYTSCLVTVEFIYKYRLIHYSTGLILSPLFCSAAWIHLLKNPLTANSCCTHLWFPGGALCQSYLITSVAIKGHKMKHPSRHRIPAVYLGTNVRVHTAVVVAEGVWHHCFLALPDETVYAIIGKFEK